MARPKIHDYEQTAFARSISTLQKNHGYSDEYVMAHIVDDYGNRLIGDVQTYGAYKSGKRKSPRDFPDVLRAFSKFYGVTTDYLLELEKTPNHQVKAVEDVTGLSDKATRQLMIFHDKYPDILQMIDVLLCESSDEDIMFFLNLYNRIYEEYKDIKAGDTSSSYDLEKMHYRFLRTQQMYNYISSTVRRGMASTFDKQILIEEDENNYFHSQEFIDSIPDIPDCDYVLEYEDGTVEYLRAEKYK